MGFVRGPSYVAHTDLKLSTIFLQQPLECWDYKTEKLDKATSALLAQQLGQKCKCNMIGNAFTALTYSLPANLICIVCAGAALRPQGARLGTLLPGGSSNLCKLSGACKSTDGD